MEPKQTMKLISQSTEAPSLPANLAQAAPVGVAGSGPFDLLFAMVAVTPEAENVVSGSDGETISEQTAPDDEASGERGDLSLLVPAVDLTGQIQQVAYPDLAMAVSNPLAAQAEVLVVQAGDAVKASIGDVPAVLDRGLAIGQDAAAIPQWIQTRSSKAPIGKVSQAAKAGVETFVAHVSAAPKPQKNEGKVNWALDDLPSVPHLTVRPDGTAETVSAVETPEVAVVLQENPSANNGGVPQTEAIDAEVMLASDPVRFPVDKSQSAQSFVEWSTETKLPLQFADRPDTPAVTFVDPKMHNDDLVHDGPVSVASAPPSPDRAVQQGQKSDIVNSVDTPRSGVQLSETDKAKPQVAQKPNIISTAMQDDSWVQDGALSDRVHIQVPARHAVTERRGVLPEVRQVPSAEGPSVLLDSAKPALDTFVASTVKAPIDDPLVVSQSPVVKSDVAAVGSSVQADTLAMQRPPTSATPPPVQLPEVALNMRQADWGRQLVDRIERISRDGSESLELSLRPKTLGALRINLEIQGDRTSVHFVTETGSAARMLLGSEDKLSQLLDQSGFRLGGFSAQGGGAGGGQNGQPQSRKERVSVQTGKRVGALASSDTAKSTSVQSGTGPESSVNMLA